MCKQIERDGLRGAAPESGKESAEIASNRVLDGLGYQKTVVAAVYRDRTKMGSGSRALAREGDPMLLAAGLGLQINHQT